MFLHGGRADGIPNGAEDRAMMAFDGLAQDGLVARERIRHDVGMLLPQPRAALDIGE
jgi:hypothetical protein